MEPATATRDEGPKSYMRLLNQYNTAPTRQTHPLPPPPPPPSTTRPKRHATNTKRPRATGGATEVQTCIIKLCFADAAACVRTRVFTRRGGRGTVRNSLIAADQNLKCVVLNFWTGHDSAKYCNTTCVECCCLYAR